MTVTQEMLDKQGVKLCLVCHRVMWATDPDTCEDCQKLARKASPKAQPRREAASKPRTFEPSPEEPEGK